MATLRLWVVVWIGYLCGWLFRLVQAPYSLPELLVELERHLLAARRWHQLLLHDRTSAGPVRVLGELDNVNVTIVPFRLGQPAHPAPPVEPTPVSVQARR